MQEQQNVKLCPVGYVAYNDWIQMFTEYFYISQKFGQGKYNGFTFDSGKKGYVDARIFYDYSDTDSYNFRLHEIATTDF